MIFAWEYFKLASRFCFRTSWVGIRKSPLDSAGNFTTLRRWNSRTLLYFYFLLFHLHFFIIWNLSVFLRQSHFVFFPRLFFTHVRSPRVANRKWHSCAQMHAACNNVANLNVAGTAVPTWVKRTFCWYKKKNLRCVLKAIWIGIEGFFF